MDYISKFYWLTVHQLNMSYKTPKKLIDVGPRGNQESLSVLSTGKQLKFFSQEDKQIGKGTPIKDLSGNQLNVESVS